MDHMKFSGSVKCIDSSSFIHLYIMFVAAGVGNDPCVHVSKCDNMCLCLCAEGRISGQTIVIGTMSVVLRQNQK